MTLGLLLAHATNNLLNDFTDWYNGVDQRDYFRTRYGTHPMSVMSKGEMFKFILFTGTLAAIVAVSLVYIRGMGVLYLTLAGSFFLLFYTWPLKFIGLGEISVFVVWGLLMIGGGYYTITQKWNWDVCVASVPYSLGATSIIMGKHIDKLFEDHKKGIYTLPVILGHFLSRSLVLVILAFQYISVVYLVFFEGYFSKVMLIVFAAVPWLPAPIYLQSKPEKIPPNFPENIWPLYYVAYAFRHNSIFGSLYVLGMIIDTYISFGHLGY